MLIQKFRALKLGHGYIDERTGHLGATYFDKQHTPTMGGLIILAAILIPVILFARIHNVYIIVLMVTTVWLGLIGLLDDYIKVFKRNKKGLHGKFKILGQVSLGIFVGSVIIAFLRA